MSSFITPPGDNGPPTPIEISIPPTDFVAQGKSQAAGLSQGGFWQEFVKTVLAAIPDGLGGTVQALCAWLAEEAVKGVEAGGGTVGTLTSCLDSMESIGTALLSQFQGRSTLGFAQLVRRALEDTLGVSVPPIPAAGGSVQGQVTAMQATGGALVDLLKQEFLGGGSDLTPDGGLKAVEAFMGFAMAFAVREGNVAFWTELLNGLKPGGVSIDLNGIREMNVAMARNIGLGRLARLVLRPLIQVLAVTPATWKLNQDYRPTRLKEADLLRLDRQMGLTPGQYKSEMQLLGYRDADIDALRNELLHEMTPEQWTYQIGAGKEARDHAQEILVALGYTSKEADDQLTVQSLIRIDKHYRVLLDYVIQGIRDGYLTTQQAIGIQTGISSSPDVVMLPDTETVGGLIGGLPLSDQEKHVIASVIRTIAQVPRSRLTPAELSTALEGGFLDPGLYTQQLRLHGYDILEQQILIEEALLKLTTGKTTAKAKELTLAEAKAALKAGVMTDAGFRTYLSDVGYNAAAINVLMALYASTPPPPAPPPAVAPPA